MTFTEIITQFGSAAIFAAIVAWLGRLYIHALVERERQNNRKEMEMYKLVLNDEYDTYRRLWRDLASIYGNFHNIAENHIPEGTKENLRNSTMNLCNDTMTFLLQARPFVDEDVFRLSAAVAEKVRNNLSEITLSYSDYASLKSARDRIYGDFEAVCYRMKGRVHEIRADAHIYAIKKSEFSEKAQPDAAKISE